MESEPGLVHFGRARRPAAEAAAWLKATRWGVPQRVAFSHAAAPPPAAVLAKMDEAGFELTHLYGLTETYGPATLNEWHAAWDELPPEERLEKRIRQGVRYHALEGLAVMDPETMEEVDRRRRDAGRGHVPRQYRDEGLSQQQDKPPTRRSPAAGSIPAISA